MFEAVQGLLDEHAALERELSDPAVLADQTRARRAGRRYAALGQVVGAYNTWLRLADDFAAAVELSAEDEAFAREAEELRPRVEVAAQRLLRRLLPRSPYADNDVIIEVKAGEGGDESALFAGDLLRMYTRYAERMGWQIETLEQTETELGGIKSSTVAVKAGSSIAESTPYLRLRFEAGVHRVQRIPVTESQGRIHTSAAGVLVMPEPEEVDVSIADKDLRYDVYRSSGPGGQSVNTTDSAVRITHLPTGIVVTCQNEKSQLQNKEQALRILRARLVQRAEDEAAATAAATRKSQVSSVDRSERIRTYNYPQSRVTDHRIGFSTHNLPAVMDGDLDAIVQALAAADEAERLQSLDSVGGTATKN